ncbi:TetR/AcrR family transcriptional regulator [Roseomonas sp. CCTCC AB2023176]|uniref:TetR/AcrR family transcriptional regulator n=1 Tax=Roseomonas sp. CCTCC AB2023176 TaxID=3342640 RepID=UPI0035D7722C
MGETVKNSAPRRRGRPPAYDRDKALDAAARLFRRQGYDATSLDDLSAATGMNRPSLYGAFGDKRALYAAILSRAREGGAAAMARILSPDRPLREGLRAVYRDALALTSTGRRPRRAAC